jgi:hypothetical protein
MPILTPGQERKSGRRWVWVALITAVVIGALVAGGYCSTSRDAIYIGPYALYGPDCPEYLIFYSGRLPEGRIGPFWIVRHKSWYWDFRHYP